MNLIRLGSKPPLTVSPDEFVFELTRAMTERNVAAASVLDRTTLIGIVTERDVVQKVVAAARDPKRTRVGDVMTSPAVSIGIKTTVNEAAALMRKNHFRHLVVVDDEKSVVGILAQRYVLYDILDDMERSVGDLIGYIMTDGPGG